MDRLAATAEKYIGKLLYVEPVDVYSWVEVHLENGQLKESPIDALLAPFRIRVMKLFFYEGSRRGAVGKVEENGHPYNSYWITLSTRIAKEYSFEKSEYYDVILDKEEPTKNHDGWPQPENINQRVSLAGFAGIIDGNRIGLYEKSEKYIGRLLDVKPIDKQYWAETYHENGQVKLRYIDMPEPFKIRVMRFVSCCDIRVGAVGKVEGKGHPYDGYWVKLSMREWAKYSFEKLEAYRITLDRDEPTKDKDVWPLPRDINMRVDISGFAEVVATK